MRAARRYLNEVATVGPSDPYSKTFQYFGKGAALMAPQGIIYNERYLAIGDETLIGPNVCLTAGISGEQTMLSSPMVTTGELSIVCSPLIPAVRQTFGPMSVSSPMAR